MFIFFIHAVPFLQQGLFSVHFLDRPVNYSPVSQNAREKLMGNQPVNCIKTIYSGFYTKQPTH